jgi:hypothetical protein
MNPNTKLFDLYAEACQGQIDPMVFLAAFHDFCHDIDDVIDGDKPLDAESLIRILMKANALYSTPFFVMNSVVLSTIISQIANTYLDSVHWERDKIIWKRQVADVLRLCGNDMIRAVANIVGGFTLVRSLSLRLREFNWRDQHEETYA